MRCGGEVPQLGLARKSDRFVAVLSSTGHSWNYLPPNPPLFNPARIPPPRLTLTLTHSVWLCACVRVCAL